MKTTSPGESVGHVHSPSDPHETGKPCACSAAPPSEREAFEKEATKRGWVHPLHGLERIGDHYLDNYLEKRWETWQAVPRVAARFWGGKKMSEHTETPYWACEYPACACPCRHIAGTCEYCHWIGAVYKPKAALAPQAERTSGYCEIHQQYGHVCREVGAAPAETARACSNCGHPLPCHCDDVNWGGAETAGEMTAEQVARKMVFHKFYEDEGVDKICIISHLGYGGYWAFDVDLDSRAIESVQTIIAGALEAFAKQRVEQVERQRDEMAKELHAAINEPMYSGTRQDWIHRAQAAEAKTVKLNELVYQIGRIAIDEGETWRLKHPELMDAYEAVACYIPKEITPSQNNGVRITHVDTKHDLPW